MESKKRVLFVFNKNTGFYASYFFFLCAVLFCKENDYELHIDDIQSAFFSRNYRMSKYINYPYKLRESINYDYVFNPCSKNFVSMGLVYKYTMQEYKNIINEQYLLTDFVKNKVNETIKNINLPDQYDAVMIRRGDKLATESVLLGANLYAKKLFEVNPNCKFIFVHSDDNIACDEFIDSIKDKNINCYKITDTEQDGGTFLFTSFINSKSTIEQNSEYYEKVKNTVKKCTANMNKHEKHDHFMRMIIAFEIIQKSNILVTDYQSNSTRFLKLYHNNMNNVYSVLDDTQINMDRKLCPCYGF